MPTFRLKEPEVEAFRIDKQITIRMGKSEASGLPGEYLVVLPSGRVTFLGDGLFEELFAPSDRGAAARKAWATRRAENGNGRKPAAAAKPQKDDTAEKPEAASGTFVDAVFCSLAAGPKTTAEIEQDLRDSGITPRKNRVSEICSQRKAAGQFSRDNNGRWRVIA